MSFSKGFNKWLIEQGKEPVSDELAEIMDDAWEATKESMLRDKEQIKDSIRFLGAKLADAALESAKSK